METEIFYWTGVIVVWGLCIAVIAGAVVSPLVTFVIVKKYLWRWRWAAEIGHTGLDKGDIYHIMSIDTPDDVGHHAMIDFYKEVKERKDLLNKSKIDMKRVQQ